MKTMFNNMNIKVPETSPGQFLKKVFQLPRATFLGQNQLKSKLNVESKLKFEIDLNMRHVFKHVYEHYEINVFGGKPLQLGKNVIPNTESRGPFKEQTTSSFKF